MVNPNVEIIIQHKISHSIRITISKSSLDRIKEPYTVIRRDRGPEAPNRVEDL